MRIISGKHRATKLYTLDGLDTRPTLDRVKEPLFSMINSYLQDAVVLDLFAGSGALGLEAISRGADRAVLCDYSPKAIDIIEKNVEKLKENSKVQIINQDYKKALEKLSHMNMKFDIVFLDPPYATEFSKEASRKIVEYDLLKQDGIIIIETDQENKMIDDINQLNLFSIEDTRKYGRVSLLFLKLKCTDGKDK